MNSKFSEPLAVHVAAGLTVIAAADKVGCSESTAYHISGTKEFRARVNELRTEITSEAVGRLSHGATQAAETLIELLDAANEPTVRLQASKAILASLPAFSEFGELRQRIDQLESQSKGLRIAQ
ncbi:MAG: hypothetical protein NXI28_15255 [bacterium]|nr:hypothetical protein [bacterium]